MQPRINGYIVVRKKEFYSAYLETEAGPVPLHPKPANGRYYGGLHRGPWENYNVARYSRDINAAPAPAELALAYDSMEERCAPFIPFTADLGECMRFFNFGQTDPPQDEVIAVSSSVMNRISRPFESPVRVRSLGFDVILPGEWSLLAEGYFFDPIYFSIFSSSIGASGLLLDLETAERYSVFYQEAGAAGKVEPIPENVRGENVVPYYAEIFSVDLTQIS